MGVTGEALYDAWNWELPDLWLRMWQEKYLCLSVIPLQGEARYVSEYDLTQAIEIAKLKDDKSTPVTLSVTAEELRILLAPPSVSSGSDDLLPLPSTIQDLFYKWRKCEHLNEMAIEYFFHYTNFFDHLARLLEKHNCGLALTPVPGRLIWVP